MIDSHALPGGRTGVCRRLARITTPLLLLVATMPVAGATQQLSDHGAVTHTHTIENADGAAYLIHVTLPPGHEPGDSAVAIYYLDGWWLGELVRGTWAIASLSGAVTEPAVLVGVSQPGDQSEWHRRRNRDLTPSPFRAPVPGVTVRMGDAELDSAGTGGAPAFLALLRDQVFPLVERKYAAGHRRGIVGHSFGGLFALWAVQRDPALFDRVLLISPALWWNGAEVLEPAGMSRAGEAPPGVTMFVARGSREPLLARAFDSLTVLGAAIEAPGFEFSSRVYEGQDHASIIPRALYDGFVRLFGKDEDR